MPALAMLYSPWQEWEDVYELPEAIRRGTIFPGLDKPFLEGACSCV
ncbi:spore coat associated protein CotJA [Anaerotruncus sp. X29]|nr:spore coat associated protein CotJA [Anaerotruncus sp. 1XD42-93]NCE74712.1 spore coat associated protein CotJA [Anaerotruncus sp. X29]RKJ92463.1 spore coat associated protein CotJA [Anaerotruncus sp. 1XD22-93]